MIEAVLAGGLPRNIAIGRGPPGRSRSDLFFGAWQGPWSYRDTRSVN
jgi:hypothetical protein